MEQFKNLPVFKEFEKIKQKWSENSHLILRSPTGSGKSLALPYLLKESGLVQGKILVAQPRRIAARMLAKKLAKISNWELGNQVGYQVRFDKIYSQETQILYATDGIVLNKLLAGDSLNDVEVLILDEFHERSAQLDLSLALALSRSRAQKGKLRIVVTSATLDRCLLMRYIPEASFVEFSGRSFPVQIEYKVPSMHVPVWKAVVEIIPKLLKKTEGDILVFLDGVYEISKTVNSILSSTWARGLDVRPLYGDLSSEKQDMALSSTGKRKIIISTNIAETSLTIEGVRIVVDTGKAKKMRYDNVRGINALLSESISKSSAEQRTGRAGRLGPGYCLRLWSNSEHEKRPEFDSPEIFRIDLSGIYLNFAGMGVDLEKLDLLNPLSEDSVCSAKEKLKFLGAIDTENKLTEHGKKMSLLPTHPYWAHALLVGKKNNLLPTISLILALLEGRPITSSIGLEDFCPMPNPRSDIYCLLLAFEEAKRRNFSIEECRKIGVHAGRCYEAEQVAQELCNIAGTTYRFELPNYEKLAKTLLQSFPDKVAYVVSHARNVYEDYYGRYLHLNNQSVVGGETFILTLQVIERKVKGRIVLEMSDANGLDEKWVRDSLQSQIVKSTEVVWDSHSRKVLNRTKEVCGNLVFSISETEDVNQEDKAKAYSKALMNGAIKLKNWNARVEKLLHRQSFLSSNFPDLGLIDMDDDTKGLFFEQLCLNASSWKEIKNLEVFLPLLNSLSQEERELLEKAVPETFDLGVGKRPYPLDYSSKKEVVLRAILQDLYDVKKHPQIVFGRYPLVVEILAPNRRTVQRTSDLPSFWECSYPSVRKDLAGRYPKHEWR